MKIGVILSGCGVMDGSEIHEAVLTLLAIDKAGHEAVCMAPSSDQAHVVNHLTNEATDEKRNVLVESARIARGKVQDIKQVKADSLDAVILPGGFGRQGVAVTIGMDTATAGALEKMGAQHQNCEVREFAVDEKNKIVTTPAYMLAQSIREADEGINKLVIKVIALA